MMNGTNGGSVHMGTNGTAHSRTGPPPPTTTVSKRRPSIESSDSEDDEQPKRTNTLNSNGGSHAQLDGTQVATPASSTKKLNRKEKRALKSKHRKINKKHPEFELTYDMMLGIRTVVGNNPITSSKASPASGVRAKEDSVLKLTFPGKGSSHTPAHAMRDFKFKDYSADIFRKIRDRFKIDPTEYLLCVCGNFQYLEFISNSKSGQFFFYSHDRQYMIKTISGGECKFLRSILPSYLEHVESNPNTLLTRFYGMHRVKPHKKKEVHFLIMGSVFYTSKFVHTVFDLKGSRQGRNATQKEKDSGAAVYKDNDFLDMGITIKLGAERAKLLNEQIANDVEWLRKLNIMDYSLLLGIHYKDRVGDVYGPQSHDTNTRTQSKLTTQHTGLNNGSAGNPMSPNTAQASGLANERREILAGVTGDLVASGNSEVHRLPPMREEDDRDETVGGIYTQLHPRIGGGLHGDETSHLEPHSHLANHAGADELHTPLSYRTQPTLYHQNSNPITSHLSEYHQRSPSHPDTRPQSPATSPIRNITLTLPSASAGTTTAAPLASATSSSQVAASSSPPNATSDSDDELPVVQFHYEEDEEEEEKDEVNLPPSSLVIRGNSLIPATPRRTSTTSNLHSLSPRFGTLPSPTTSGQPPPRVNRSQSVIPHSPTNLGAINAVTRSPTGGSSTALTTEAASAAAAAKTKKELEAAAKLDAIAKQTAYGLPKKYNKVSKPGDIAFPFEFQETDLTTGTTSLPNSQPTSPAHAIHIIPPSNHSPTLASTLPGAHTAFESLSPPKLGAPTSTSGGSKTNENTPSLKGRSVDPSRHPATSSSWELPPPLIAPLSPQSTLPASNSHPTTATSLLTPIHPPRALSVFASPNSKEAQQFHAQIGSRGIFQSPGPPIPNADGSASSSPEHLHPLPIPSASTVAATHVGLAPSLVPPAAGIPIELSTQRHPRSHSIGNVDDHKMMEMTTGNTSTGETTGSHDKLDLFGTAGGCAGHHSDGTPNNEIYFMGIIDILTLYTIGKKSENFFKSLKYTEEDISAVNPTLYAERFKKFIANALR